MTSIYVWDLRRVDASTIAWASCSKVELDESSEPLTQIHFISQSKGEMVSTHEFDSRRHLTGLVPSFWTIEGLNCEHKFILAFSSHPHGGFTARESLDSCWNRGASLPCWGSLPAVIHSLYAKSTYLIQEMRLPLTLVLGGLVCKVWVWAQVKLVTPERRVVLFCWRAYLDIATILPLYLPLTLQLSTNR